MDAEIDTANINKPNEETELDVYLADSVEQATESPLPKSLRNGFFLQILFCSLGMVSTSIYINFLSIVSAAMGLYAFSMSFVRIGVLISSFAVNILMVFLQLFVLLFIVSFISHTSQNLYFGGLFLIYDGLIWGQISFCVVIIICVLTTTIKCCQVLKKTAKERSQPLAINIIQVEASS